MGARARRKQRQWYFRKEGQQSKAEFIAGLSVKLALQIRRQNAELDRLINQLHGPDDELQG